MEVIFTGVFRKWLNTLRDKTARTVILKHIDRMKNGNLGDTKNLGEQIFEKRIFYGAGYRLYFINKNGQLIIILCGRDKSSQPKDIKKAKQIVKEI